MYIAREKDIGFRFGFIVYDFVHGFVFYFCFLVLSENILVAYLKRMDAGNKKARFKLFPFSACFLSPLFRK